MPGHITQAQSPIADYVVMSLILAQPQTLVEIDREIFSMVIILLPLIQEGLLSVTNERQIKQTKLTMPTLTRTFWPRRVGPASKNKLFRNRDVLLLFKFKGMKIRAICK